MVLLHKRDNKTKESPNMWDFFGGAIEGTENVEDAAIREIYEELGIVISKNDLNELKESVYYIFFPKYRTKDLRLDEGAGFAWFTFDEAILLENLTNTAKGYLKLMRELKLQDRF